MGPVPAITTCLRKFTTFSGRASRSEYWWFVAFCLLVSWFPVTLIISSDFGIDPALAEPIPTQKFATFLAVIALLYLVVAPATSRRFHDAGKSALFALGLFATTFFCVGLAVNISFLFIVPATISAALLTFYLFRPSQSGPNTYGPNPHEVTP